MFGIPALLVERKRVKETVGDDYRFFADDDARRYRAPPIFAISAGFFPRSMIGLAENGNTPARRLAR